MHPPGAAFFLIQHSEAHTGQYSPPAPEVCKKHATSAKRVNRGLCKDGSLIWNVGAAGAFNLMRLWLAKEHPVRRLSRRPYPAFPCCDERSCAAAPAAAVPVSWTHPVGAYLRPGNSVAGAVCAPNLRSELSLSYAFFPPSAYLIAIALTQADLHYSASTSVTPPNGTVSWCVKNPEAIAYTVIVRPIAQLV